MSGICFNNWNLAQCEEFRCAQDLWLSTAFTGTAKLQLKTLYYVRQGFLKYIWRDDSNKDQRQKGLKHYRLRMYTGHIGIQQTLWCFVMLRFMQGKSAVTHTYSQETGWNKDNVQNHIISYTSSLSLKHTLSSNRNYALGNMHLCCIFVL